VDKQKHLDLQAAPIEGEDDAVAQEVPAFLEAPPRRERVSKEVLFSRFLAGIIDLTVPIVTALVFGGLASLYLEVELFSQQHVVLVGSLAMFFFFLNSLFFLLACGQTPGMFVTELRLVSEEDGRNPNLGTILLRVLLFLPSLASVAGVASSLFDPMARCVHDLLSGTRVEPLEKPRPIDHRVTEDTER
jgi:uncharacterized RDD family membrane protein YckC